MKNRGEQKDWRLGMRDLRRSKRGKNQVGRERRFNKKGNL